MYDIYELIEKGTKPEEIDLIAKTLNLFFFYPYVGSIIHNRFANPVKSLVKEGLITKERTYYLADKEMILDYYKRVITKCEEDLENHKKFYKEVEEVVSQPSYNKL